MATYQNATRKFVGRDTYIPEGDIREILDIVEPESGAPYLVVAGPKGGSFRLHLPEWFVNQSLSDIVVGDGVANGGWLSGRFVVPEFYEAD